jgi:hypothetical protein
MVLAEELAGIDGIEVGEVVDGVLAGVLKDRVPRGT